ncbi:MAG: hypothetical protein JWM33_1447 [Caulobacteraceae bacterium]|nr:hypothetical protein [Caulobacteraceae bacterium]
MLRYALAATLLVLAACGEAPTQQDEPPPTKKLFIAVPNVPDYPACRKVALEFDTERTAAKAKEVEKVCQHENIADMNNPKTKPNDPCMTWAGDVVVIGYKFWRAHDDPSNMSAVDGLPMAQERARQNAPLCEKARGS